MRHLSLSIIALLTGGCASTTAEVYETSYVKTTTPITVGVLSKVGTEPDGRTIWGRPSTITVPPGQIIGPDPDMPPVPVVAPATTIAP